MKEAGEIEDLSVRQLKEVLATSYVHYKGCCEKWELVERVTRLFHEKQKNKERGMQKLYIMNASCNVNVLNISACTSI